MSQSLKVIKNRIKGVGDTQKVTNAMQMVSVAKLNRVAKILYAIRPYILKLEGLLNNLAALESEIGHPLLEKRMPVKKKALCVITSDNGLCGLYNTGVLHSVEDFLSRNGKDDIIIAVGKRGYNFFKSKAVAVHSVYLGLNGRYNYEVADNISKELIDLFLKKK
ncbi:MAG: F0F1 ATP synthase subunit gamma, partial [Candidatus Omnitrophica bacterium]|nr:F0F1 ATP synthase subunit gamma [Candidatus Omnitrophota bacterium]